MSAFAYRPGQRRCLMCREIIHPSPTSLGRWENTSTGTIDLCGEHNEAAF